jgi:hypothetical protein
MVSIVSVLCGCGGVSSTRSDLKAVQAAFQTAPGDTWLRTELFFGLNKPDGVVTDAEWQSFVQEVITPLFPDGLTVINGSGHWKDHSGRIQNEGCRVLILLHPPQQQVNDRIEQVRTIYCTRFRQEAVLRVTFPARVSFQSPATRASGSR